MKFISTFLLLFILQFSYAQTLQDSLLAHYPFTGNANDASGNNNHGVVNGAILTADRFGNANSAYYFDGVDDIIRMTNFNNNVIPSKTHFSASFWVKTTTAQNGGMLGYGTACSSLSDDYLAIGLSYTNGRNHLVGRFMQLLPMIEVHDSYIRDGNWHLITYTFETGTAKVYIGSQLISTKAVTNYPANNFTYSNIIDWTIGGFHSNNCSHGTNYEGVIDEVRIYNRTLTSQEVSTLVGQPLANFVASIQSCDLNVTFLNNSSNANSYQWDFGDGNTSTQMSPTHTYTNSGSYIVTLTATNGSSQSTDTQTIQASSNIVASFISPSIVYVNSPITFTDNSIDATSWFWDFGNGTLSTSQNPTVVFTNSGLTDITLIASSGNNCSDTIIKQVNIRGSVNTLEQFSEQNLQIMPVPANQHLNIDFQFDGQKDLKIQIVNVLGQVILEEIFPNSNEKLATQFDVRQLATGNYIINISEYDNSKVVGQLSRQIVIQH